MGRRLLWVRDRITAAPSFVVAFRKSPLCPVYRQGCSHELTTPFLSVKISPNRLGLRRVFSYVVFMSENNDGAPDGVSKTAVSTARIDPFGFPDAPKLGSTRLQTTLPNVDHLLTQVGITPQYNEVTKDVVLNKRSGGVATLNEIVSVAVFNGLNANLVLQFIPDLADKNPYNPVPEWIDSRPWDGVDRLNALYDTVDIADGYPESLKRTLIYRWLLSAAASAVKPRGFKTRGVLTLQGPQGCGKTSWIGSLVSDPALRETVIRLDHHLDGGNKDSVIGAIKNWIVEIGELDSSFKRDIGKIKGFLTLDCDKLRKPYGRGESEFKRTTVFAATVNDFNFLVDPTGNNRWFTISVEKLNFRHEIDTQQLFAQLAVDVRNGVAWVLNDEEEQSLNLYNLQHRSVSVVKERMLEAFDLAAPEGGVRQPKTAIEVLIAAGFSHPTNAQCKEAGAVLREYLGPPKRNQGRDKWRVPSTPSAGYDFDRKSYAPPEGDDF